MVKYLMKGISIFAVLFFCWTGIAHAEATLSQCHTRVNGKVALNQAACDVSFTSAPTFAGLCVGSVAQTNIYTIKNNTPVTMKLNFIRVVNADGTVNSDATIGVAPTNNCGASLAAGASCNIQVDLNPSIVETFNLLLQVGIDSRQGILQTPINVSSSAANCFALLSRPTFTQMCASGPSPQTGTFTYINNTSTPVVINSIQIVNPGDSFGVGAVTITAGPNSCSTSTPVGVGSTCNVYISIQPGAGSGAIARTLQLSVSNNQLLVSPINVLVTPTCGFGFSIPLPFVPTDLLCNTTQLLTYNIVNNTVAAETINSIDLVQADALPASAAIILSTSCPDPGPLASGASCTIVVQLFESCSGTLGVPLARTLEVNTAGSGTVSAPTITTTFTSTTPPAPDYLGAAGLCAVLGGQTVTNASGSGTVVTGGDVCVAPGTSITGFSPGNGIIVGGVPLTAPDPIPVNAYAALVGAISTLGNLPCSNDLTGHDLGGLTLTAGVYCFSSAAGLTGTLTLSGGPNDVFVFKTGTSLITASNSQVLLQGGALPANVYWVVGSSATLGSSSLFQGNILAVASITMGTNANLELGRALAEASVTLGQNLITVP